MRRMLLLTCVAVGLIAPAAAQADIAKVFNNTITCTVQTGTNAGQRFCGTTANTTVPSWDGTPIDVSVAFPVATGDDTKYPLVGIYHGWGGSKVTPSNAASTRWTNKGYAVMSITDRGWGSSCGGSNGANPAKAAPCTNGYIHLLHNAYEVRDAQYLMGLLADDGVIDPTKIAAGGGSYGGGMAMQLGALKNRVQLPDGSLTAWKSPAGKDMSIAATVPEYGWSDIADALLPNGSSYDYVAQAPYRGLPGSVRRVGVEKQNWNQTLNSAGVALGYYAPMTGTGFPDPAGNMTGWFTTIETGGPYDSLPAAQDLVTELTGNHSAYGIDDSVAPAPALLSNGWNDDLFPVDESVRYYNRVRADHPTTPVSLFQLDFGHAPRANAVAADVARLTTAENAWIDYYVRGIGTEPVDALGGVDIVTSKCTGTTKVAGDAYHATSWATLAPGEVRVDGPASKTIAPGTVSSSAFTSGTVCANATSAADTTGAATYTSAAAPTGGYTIAGSPTVTATLTVTGANDFVAARLYDYDPTTTTQKLIARGTQRPVGVGAGPTAQTFQLHPQAYRIAEGHQAKLELLSADSPYLRTASASAPQQAITVSDLQLRLPVLDAPGSLGGFVQNPATKVLPAGYTLSRDVLASDTAAPTTTDDVTAAWSATPVPVTLTAVDAGVTGVDKTYYTVGATPSPPTTASSVYDPAHKPTLADGERIRYRSVDRAGNVEAAPKSSVAARVDTAPPVSSASTSPTPAGGVVASPATVTLSAVDAASGVATREHQLDDGAWTADAGPLVLPTGLHTVRYRATDAVGNVETAKVLTLDVRDPAATSATSNITSGSATLNGTLNPAVTAYQFLYRKYGETTWTELPRTPAGSDLLASTDVSGLSASSIYYFKIRATVPSAPYYYTAQASLTTPADPFGPSNIVVNAPTDVTKTGATLSASVDTGGLVTTAVLEWGTSAGSYTRSAALYRSGTGDVKVFDRSLPTQFAPGVTYHYRVATTSAAGTRTSDDQTFTTLAAGGPFVTIGAVSPLTETAATINAVVDADGDAVTATSVEWGKTTSYGKALPLLSGALTPDGRIYTRPVQSLTAGTTYHYRVTVSTASHTYVSGDLTFTTPGRG